MTNFNLLKTIWNTLYDHKIDVNTIVEKYFHRDYEQCINGVILNRTEYVRHVIEQKKNITIDTVDYKNTLEQGNELFALYYAKGNNKNNSPIEVEVIAYFRFENQQLLRIHGQVRLIQGDLADVDMKSA